MDLPRKRRTKKTKTKRTRTRRNNRRNTRRNNRRRTRRTRRNTRRRLRGGQEEKKLDSQGAEGNYDLLPEAEIPEEEGGVEVLDPVDGEFNPEEIENPKDLPGIFISDMLADRIPSADMDELPEEGESYMSPIPYIKKEK